MLYGDKLYKVAHGIVSGHKKLEDSIFIHTSEVKNIEIDKENSEAIIKTRNSEYHCPLEYCLWRKQDKYPKLIPEYEWIKANYLGKILYPEIEADKVLLVLSNFCEYYFHSLYYKPSGVAERLPFCGDPHIGMFQDSYLISCEGADIDLRYFPCLESVHFYMEVTDGKPLYIENIGDIVLYARTSKGRIRLNPGERKEVTRENAEKTELHSDDLYPA